jgi:hypothetical protein
MITVFFWGTVTGGCCYMIKLMVEIHTLSVRIKKMNAFVKDLRSTEWNKSNPS